jgi:signal transduction histidine kinase
MMKIRQKLAASILSAVLLIFVGQAYLSQISCKESLKGEIKERALNQLRAATLQIESELQGFEDIAQGLGLAMESLRPKTESEVEDLIKDFLSSRPSAYGSTISFLPDSFSAEKKYFAPYYYKGDGGLTRVDLSKPDYDYTKWDWFTVPIRTQRPMWLEPYVDVGGGDIAMTTYSFPFSNGRSPWGIATVDVSLNELTDTVNGIKIGERGYAFLISKKGTFLSLRDFDFEMKHTIFSAAEEFKSQDVEELGNAMVHGKSGFISIEDPLIKKRSWVAYGPIKSTGWSLAIVFPEDELLADLYSMRMKMAAIAIAGIIAIFFVVFHISKKITRPIGQLADGANRIASGNFSTMLPKPTTGDEVAVLTGAFNDMTQSLSRTLDELRKEKSMFQVAFSQMTDGLVILNARWNVLQFNRTAQTLLGLPAAGSIIEHIKASFECSVPWPKIENAGEKRLSFKLVRKETAGSSALHLCCILIPILDSSYRLIERVLSIRDVTAEESEDSAKRDFLSLISHKLITPIAVLEGKASLLNDGLLGELSDKQKKEVSSLSEQGHKLRGLIESLINFVTLEGSSMDMSREDLDAVKFVGDIAKQCEDKFRSKNPHITVMVESGLKAINFNRKYLDLIIRELIENGLKFNMSDPAKISVECKRDGDFNVILVSDNGIGIPQEFSERLFDKFFQIDKYFTGNVEGVGLGLALMRRIVDSFGGTISFVSTVGKGSTFTVKIPAAVKTDA